MVHHFAEFSYQIKHIAGIHIECADSLSRRIPSNNNISVEFESPSGADALAEKFLVARTSINDKKIKISNS